jgi:hypothetical protein
MVDLQSKAQALQVFVALAALEPSDLPLEL